MLGSAADFGIKKNYWLHFIGIAFIYSANSCRTRDEAEQKVQVPSPYRFSNAPSDTSDIDPDEWDEPVIDPNAPLPHPKAPTEWNTRALILSNPHPSEKRLYTCHNEIMSMAKNSQSQQDLIAQKEKLEDDVETDKVLYHWCFYHSLMILETRLAEDNLGKELNTVSNNFHASVRALWILAFSLDSVIMKNETSYFTYLRLRYLDLSEKYFGRRLEIYSPPFQGRGYSDPMTKPAAPSPSDL